jgi:hypothetical protein
MPGWEDDPPGREALTAIQPAPRRSRAAERIRKYRGVRLVI